MTVLTHPNTVTIFDYGRTDDDVYYIAMELLEGRTLHRALREDGPMPPPRALHIARQVCRSLREAHAIHIVHRDLKPANVFLCRRDDDNDFAKVLDFGLVKNTEETAEDLTQTGLFMGSPKYMAPEQIQGERADGRADIYALGVILYEMLTGRPPFVSRNPADLMRQHVSREPYPPRLAVEGVPAVLDAAVQLGVQGDQGEAREQAQDRVALAAFGVRVLEDLLDLRNVAGVLLLLLVVHLDRQRLDDRTREFEAHLGGGAAIGDFGVGDDVGFNGIHGNTPTTNESAFIISNSDLCTTPLRHNRLP